MAKLFNVTIRNTAFVLADNEEEALSKFWEDKNNYNNGASSFFEDITNIYEVEETKEVIEDYVESLPENIRKLIDEYELARQI